MDGLYCPPGVEGVGVVVVVNIVDVVAVVNRGSSGGFVTAARGIAGGSSAHERWDEARRKVDGPYVERERRSERELSGGMRDVLAEARFVDSVDAQLGD